VSLPSKKVDLMIVSVDVKVLPRQRNNGRYGKARFKLLTTQRVTTHRRAVGIEKQAALRTKNLVRAL
jgi:hypothetical protein